MNFSSPRKRMRSTLISSCSDDVQLISAGRLCAFITQEKAQALIDAGDTSDVVGLSSGRILVVVQ